MHLSRLFSAMLVVGATVGATIVACGGSSSPNKTPDAKVFKDGKVFMDAPAGSASGLGASCTGSGSGNASLCGSADPVCVTLNGSNYFCTELCGSGAGSGSAPSGGDAICMMQQTTGTAACALHGQGSGTVPWACGILCGTSGSANFGNCPTNLTCVSNFCQ